MVLINSDAHAVMEGGEKAFVAVQARYLFREDCSVAVQSAGKLLAC